ncbi:MAG: prepilin-type N-terminal cleavage/methylation domain-containing protein [Planctomycetaceae bacterium]
MTCRRHRQVTRRRGLTLLEVLLSLAIFMIAMTAISQLVSIGSRASVEAQVEADAALRAETVLNEVIAGVHPLQSTQQTTFTDDPDWVWSLDVMEGPHIDLVQLDVTVGRKIEGSMTQTTSYHSVRLSRLIRNPDLFLEAALAAEGE